MNAGQAVLPVPFLYYEKYNWIINKEKHLFQQRFRFCEKGVFLCKVEWNYKIQGMWYTSEFPLKKIQTRDEAYVVPFRKGLMSVWCMETVSNRFSALLQQKVIQKSLSWFMSLTSSWCLYNTMKVSISQHEKATNNINGIFYLYNHIF